jgi:hypothetical protein
MRALSSGRWPLIRRTMAHRHGITRFESHPTATNAMSMRAAVHVMRLSVCCP